MNAARWLSPAMLVTTSATLTGVIGVARAPAVPGDEFWSDRTGTYYYAAAEAVLVSSDGHTFATGIDTVNDSDEATGIALGRPNVASTSQGRATTRSAAPIKPPTFSCARVGVGSTSSAPQPPPRRARTWSSSPIEATVPGSGVTASRDRQAATTQPPPGRSARKDDTSTSRAEVTTTTSRSPTAEMVGSCGAAATTDRPVERTSPPRHRWPPTSDRSSSQARAKGQQTKMGDPLVHLCR